MNGKIYRGELADNEHQVTVRSGRRVRPLNPRTDYRNHSPAGLAWGYTGSGPSQLALALAADVLKDKQRALDVYMELKFALVANLPEAGWELTEEQVRTAIEQIEARQAKRAAIPDSSPADAEPSGAALATAAGAPNLKAVDEPPTEPTNRAPGRIVLPDPFGIASDFPAGVRLQESRRFRQMQLAFADKPGDAVRAHLRSAGFSWNAADRAWGIRIDPEAGWRTRVRAREVFEDVADLVRAEKGIARDRG